MNTALNILGTEYRMQFNMDAEHPYGFVENPGGHPIVVKIIADSITEGGHRLITWCWEYPRMIHAEIMTHRMLSRNSASSRAIPAARLRARTLQEPAIPFHWGANQKGMQSGDQIADIEKARQWWLDAMLTMARFHEVGEEMGLHKQIDNRLIEPWMTIAVVVSQTEYGNLFHQRKHHAAEPHFQILANLAWELFHNHMPRYVVPGGWHLPYVDGEDDHGPGINDRLVKISTARCARVSYLTHEGKRDVGADLTLHNTLASTLEGDDPGHFSPFEHPAMAVGRDPMLSDGIRYGNFVGWKQYRYFFQKQAGPSMADRCMTCGAWGGRHVTECNNR